MSSPQKCMPNAQPRRIRNLLLIALKKASRFERLAPSCLVELRRQTYGTTTHSFPGRTCASLVVVSDWAMAVAVVPG